MNEEDEEMLEKYADKIRYATDGELRDIIWKLLILVAELRYDLDDIIKK